MQERTPNERQQAVIDELDSNIILYASAGTGKTFTVAKRAANIIASGRAKADEILCLTFTIKAAQEMKEDILNYTGENGKDVDVCTIHSFSYSVLKEEYVLSLGRQAYPTVCDEVETAALLSKKALMRPVGSHNENPKAAQMETLLEDGINAIGIGPQGMGGRYSVMGVHIENTARHPSTIGVAVNVGCWSHRRGHVVFDGNLNCTVLSHSGVTLA